MNIITRAAAGLPSPSVLTRRTTPWAGITWHHTGGSPTTWKAIHNWQTDGRPEASELIYIGYSYGIGIDGRVTELRGWDYRAAGDHDNSRLQVVFMGNWATKLPPVAALNAAKEFARWAEAKAGKKLPGTAHRDVWPAGHRYDTDCPGNALYAWVRANLYTIGDDDMPLSADDLVKIWTHDLKDGTGVDKAYVVLNRAAAQAAEAVALGKANAEAIAALSVPAPAPVDPAVLKAALLDPEFLAAVAKAVVDEDHRRSAE